MAFADGVSGRNVGVSRRSSSSSRAAGRDMLDSWGASAVGGQESFRHGI
jgi:hypothetical protein